MLVGDPGLSGQSLVVNTELNIARFSLICTVVAVWMIPAISYSAPIVSHVQIL